MNLSDHFINPNFMIELRAQLIFFQDVIYHNEAYTNSSSGDGSPESEQPGSNTQNGLQQHQPADSPQKSCKSDTPLSPQRGQSFIAAVISAIKNATSKTTVLKSSTSAAAARDKREICGHGKLCLRIRNNSN